MDPNEIASIDARQLAALCTGTAPERWKACEKESGRQTFAFESGDEDSMMALFVYDDKRWYVALNYVTGGCEIRVAHGVFDNLPRDEGVRLRNDCETWPVLDSTVWRSCCERISRGESMFVEPSDGIPF